MPLEFQISPEEAGQRLDHFLPSRLSHLSRSRIQNLVRQACILVNGEQPAKAGIKLRSGDRITVEEPPPEPVETLPEEIPLDVLFEDEHLVVLNKAAGIVVHPGAGNREHTLVNALLHHCPNLSGIGGEQRPGIVHRLDKDTSGCLVVAKNDPSHRNLALQFSGRKVLKVYLAIVAGALRFKSGTVDAAIGRHPVHRMRMAVVPKGRPSRTDYRVLREWEGLSLVECTLHTGRTHQIRVHLKHLGHPLAGDTLYGGRADFPRQMLHARRLGFFHPVTNQWLEFESPIPNDFIQSGAHEQL